MENSITGLLQTLSQDISQDVSDFGASCAGYEFVYNPGGLRVVASPMAETVKRALTAGVVGDWQKAAEGSEDFRVESDAVWFPGRVIVRKLVPKQKNNALPSPFRTKEQTISGREDASPAGFSDSQA